MRCWRGTAGQGTGCPLPQQTHSQHASRSPPPASAAPDVPAVCAANSAVTLAALSSILGASTGRGSELPWDAFSRCPSALCSPSCPPAPQPGAPAHFPRVTPGGSWAGGGVAVWGGGTPGICPWNASACLEPPMLRLFLLSPSCCFCSQASAAPQQSRLLLGSPGQARLAPRGSPAGERGEDDLGANLELAFPKPFQTPRLLAGSVTAPASLSGSTVSFPWQGQQWGKNNTQKTRDV